MEIKSLKVLRGPNQWASFPVLEAWVDLGHLEDYPSNTLPGFNDRLMRWLPTMVEHRCTIGERGGFFERLRTGTWMGHILEHVTLELQSLAGTTVGFGRARETKTRGVYKGAIEYKEEKFAIECLHAAHRLIKAAIAGEAFDVPCELRRLRKALLEEHRGKRVVVLAHSAVERELQRKLLKDHVDLILIEEDFLHNPPPVKELIAKILASELFVIDLDHFKSDYWVSILKGLLAESHRPPVFLVYDPVHQDTKNIAVFRQLSKGSVIQLFPKPINLMEYLRLMERALRSPV